MCTYATFRCALDGSGKSTIGWFALSSATVSFDHPVHANAGHTLNIDLAAPERGPAARVAVELDAQSAYQLLVVIAGALSSAPFDISGLSAAQRAQLETLVRDAPSLREPVRVESH